jgi:hypothetical protein
MALCMARSVVLTAFLSTTAVFVCFTLSALMTQRRAYLYLGGYLSSAVGPVSCMGGSTQCVAGRRSGGLLKTGSGACQGALSTT